MTGLIIKLFASPIMIGLAAFLLPNVNYTSVIQPIVVGIIVAVAGHLLEVLLLKEDTISISTVLDFISATLIVFIVSRFFFNAEVTFYGALLTGILIALSEIPQHIYLVKSGRTQETAY